MRPFIAIEQSSKEQLHAVFLIFDRDAMIKEIAVAQEIITNKSAISILSNIFFSAENNTLTIKATDSSVGFLTKIPVDVQEEGSTTVYCDKFMSILSSSPQGEIEFKQEDGPARLSRIRLRAGYTRNHAGNRGAIPG